MPGFWQFPTISLELGTDGCGRSDVRVPAAGKQVLRHIYHLVIYVIRSQPLLEKSGGNCRLLLHEVVITTGLLCAGVEVVQYVVDSALFDFHGGSVF